MKSYMYVPFSRGIAAFLLRDTSQLEYRTLIWEKLSSPSCEMVFP